LKYKNEQKNIKKQDNNFIPIRYPRIVARNKFVNIGEKLKLNLKKGNKISIAIKATLKLITPTPKLAFNHTCMVWLAASTNARLLGAIFLFLLLSGR
jgi:hypothetical protein